MKIVDVQPLILRGHFILVKVLTDEGITGWGECSPMDGPVIATTVEHALKPLVVGEDPFDIERIWNKMFYSPFIYKLGPMGVLLEAMAGIDIALYDVVGKALGVPVYKLLGGAVRKKVEIYASFGHAPTPEFDARRSAQHVEMGYRAIKIHTSTPWGFDPSDDQTIETVRQIRAAVGDDIKLMVDVNNAYSVPRAIQVGQELQQYKVFHFEEPIAAYDYQGYAQVVAALPGLPIAAGEQEYTRWQHRDLITTGNVAIVQPDVVKSGGITETKKIALLASVYNRAVTVHNTQPTIGTAAHLHFWASTPNCLYPQEYTAGGKHPLRDVDPILKEPLKFKDGFLDVPEGPGLGIEIDEKAVARHMEAA